MTRKCLALLLVLVGCAPQALGYQKEATMHEEFLKAVTEGDAPRVTAMLRVDPRLATSTNERKQSAVLLATYYRKPDVVAALLATGIELNVFEAAATGATDRMRALLSQDSALVNACAPDGFFPLALAAFFGHPTTVDTLLAAGANVNAKSREGMQVTPLHSAVAANHLAIARALLAHGADPNARQAERGGTPLHEAAAIGSIELARLLVEYHADLNVRTEDGKTPLAFALARNQTEMAAWLNQHGAAQ